MDKKNSLFSIFSENLPCRKEKFLGDAFLNYQDLWDTLTDKARLVLFAGFMTRNYQLFQYSEYKGFSQLMGKLMFENFMKEEMQRAQNNPELMKKIMSEIGVVSQPETSGKDYGHYY